MLRFREVSQLLMPQYLSLLDEDLFRLGNATSPRLHHVRPEDVQTYERNGVLLVRATGEGLSVSTGDYLKKVRLRGWLWKVPATIAMPFGLALNPDPDPRKVGHFLLCPISDMTMDRYRALLSELALRCERIRAI